MGFISEVTLGYCSEKGSHKYLTGDKINHLSVSFYHGLTSTNQINKLYDSSQEKSENIFSIE